MFDLTTSRCYYVHSSTWAGLTRPVLRLAPSANGQLKGTRPATAYLYPELDGRAPASGHERPVAMLADPSPE